jgi:transposase
MTGVGNSYRRWRISGFSLLGGAAERDELLAPQQVARRQHWRCCSLSKASVRSSPLSFGSEGMFRNFDNRRQVASYEPNADILQSGSVALEQGECLEQAIFYCVQRISNSAWLWLRNQPQSALALWSEDRAAAVSIICFAIGFFRGV